MPMPSIITDADANGIDYWVICDDTDCYMFFSALNDVLYRARTEKSAFPDGFGEIDIVMEDDKFRLFDSSNVYKLAGTDKYLLLVSAIGSIDRYFRAWTADTLDGSWTPLAETESNASDLINNVTDADWALSGFEHGEMLRSNPDETMTIDTCDMRYLYSGITTRAIEGDDSSHNEYSLGLLANVQ